MATSKARVRERAAQDGVSVADPCAYCSGPASTLDHIEPKSRGGFNKGNLTASCEWCNRRKADLPLVVFLARRRRVSDIRKVRPKSPMLVREMERLSKYVHPSPPRRSVPNDAD